VLAAAGAGGWNVYGRKLLGQQSGATTAPSRRFFVYIKSEPPGANIYRVDNNTLMGATPVTLPIELVGTSSMRIRLEKPGYESFEQTVSGSDPISISLSSSTPGPADAGPAAAPAPKPVHHRRRPSQPVKEESDDDTQPAAEGGGGGGGEWWVGVGVFEGRAN